MSLVSFDELASKVGTRKVMTIKAWCARNRVAWFADAKGRPMTTMAALDRALLRGKDEENEPNWEAVASWGRPRGRRKSSPGQ